MDVVDLHCVMWDFFCFGAQTLVVVCRLSFPKACRILVPRPGIEPTSSGLQSGLLTTKSWEVPNFPFFTTPCLFLVALSLLPLQQAQILQKFPFSHNFVSKPQSTSQSSMNHKPEYNSRKSTRERSQGHFCFHQYCWVLGTPKNSGQ